MAYRHNTSVLIPFNFIVSTAGPDVTWSRGLVDTFLLLRTIIISF